MSKLLHRLRKTRFVCVSDTHNAVPGGAFKLPEGDVLVHAGDLTKQGTYTELQKAVKWIESANFETKIVIAGNHDITLDSSFYDQYGQNFHNQTPQDKEKCQMLLEKSPSIIYLKHEAAVVKLTASNGPQTGFKIFGSPYSLGSGSWAFSYQPGEADSLWETVPLDTDIIVTHTPAKHHCDTTLDQRAAGCEALRCTLWRVKPWLAICGHIHEGRGAEIIGWDLDASDAKHGEARVEQWIDPGKDNKKISFVDLTKRGKGERATASYEYVASEGMVQQDPGHSRSEPSGEASVSEINSEGSISPSDQQQLSILSRLRKETCVVNAAIMGSSWPYKQAGGKKYNKPIVIDIDLPVWTDQ